MVGFSLAVPPSPAARARGDTREEALSIIREAIEVYIESLAHGDPFLLDAAHAPGEPSDRDSLDPERERSRMNRYSYSMGWRKGR